MTESQLAAFEGVLDQGLRLVWGPPGTGEDAFLAADHLVPWPRPTARPSRVRTLLTAFTTRRSTTRCARPTSSRAGAGIVAADSPSVAGRNPARAEASRVSPPRSARSAGAGRRTDRVSLCQEMPSSPYRAGPRPGGGPDRGPPRKPQAGSPSCPCSRARSKARFRMAGATGSGRAASCGRSIRPVKGESSWRSRFTRWVSTFLGVEIGEPLLHEVMRSRPQLREETAGPHVHVQARGRWYSRTPRPW